ncbi:MAG: Fpg/Nei family DNA glycosylase [Longimicrobiales bacterium]
MPELPEIETYLHALEARLRGAVLETVRVRSPALLRTYDPPLSSAHGRRVLGVRRLGKRIVLALEGDLYLVLHLMITGRLSWQPRGAKVPGRVGLAAFDFDTGTLLLTEAGTKKRAALHVVQGGAIVAELDRGGIEPLEASLEAFGRALRSENHTLKRALTDPRILSGIGNAHSDEILHAARLSPFKRTAQLSDEEVARLFETTRTSLVEWIERLRGEVGEGFPKKITAFHPAMRVHGRFRQPCPVCGTAIQRVVHGEHETNYCPRCQTGGRVLRDRALSRLLGDDWPRTIDALEGV